MGNTSKREFSPFLKQAFVTCGVVLNIIGHGCVIGFPAILFAQLEQKDSHIQTTLSERSWIASVVGFSLLAGNPITPYLSARFGRKITHITTMVPLIAGWITIALAKDVHALLVARILHGFSLGLMGPLQSMLIGEYTSPKNRGAFLVLVSLALAFGVLFVHTLGSFLHWQLTAVICISFTFLSVLVCIFSPETPSWLSTKGRYEECRNVFYWLRGKDDDQIIELEAMIAARVAENEMKVEKSKNLKQHLSRTVTIIKKKEFYKPIIIMLHLYSMYQFAGINVLCSYTTTIIQEIVGEEANAYFWMIALDVQRLLSNSFAIYLLKKIKRRKMLIYTGVLNVVSYLAMAAYVFLKRHGHLYPWLETQWIPIFLINCFMFSLGTGMVPLPFILAGEVFPIAYRSLGNGLGAISLSIMFFVAVKAAPSLFETIGIHGTFTIYATVVAYCLVVTLWMLPETKDRTLQDIEEEFKGEAKTAQEMKPINSVRFER